MWSSSSRIQASLFRRTPLGLTLLPARPPHNSSSFSCITGLSTQQETGRAAERARNDSAHQPASTAFASRPAATTLHLVRMWLHTCGSPISCYPHAHDGRARVPCRSPSMVSNRPHSATPLTGLAQSASGAPKPAREARGHQRNFAREAFGHHQAPEPLPQSASGTWTGASCTRSPSSPRAPSAPPAAPPGSAPASSMASGGLVPSLMMLAFHQRSSCS